MEIKDLEKYALKELHNRLMKLHDLISHPDTLNYQYGEIENAKQNIDTCIKDICTWRNCNKEMLKLAKQGYGSGD